MNGLDGLLKRIESGKAKPTRVTELVAFGTVEFEVEGWRIEVFSDAFDFDYIEAATDPDGNREDGGDGLLSYYRPDTAIGRRAWGGLR